MSINSRIRTKKRKRNSFIIIFVCIKNINYINREPPFSSRALSELKTSFVNVSSSLSCIELFEVDDLMP